jgi:diguanylate cyclase (GGDEF)-like protein
VDRPPSSTSGLEAVIDACAGILAEQSLEATLHEMARRLAEIVPFTSIAVYEVDPGGSELVPMFAQGLHVEQTLASRPPLHDSISGKAVSQRRLIHLEPGHEWLGRYTMPGTPDEDPEALIVAPLLVAGEPVGTLNVWREEERPSFSDEEAQLLRRFATLAALAYVNARQRDLLRRQALTDELTAAYNRRHFYDRLSAELADVRRHGHCVALVVLDVDDFKAVNDRHGHPAGDETLRAFAGVLRREVRAGDVVCRTGGEEFAVIAPHIACDEGRALVQRLVRAVAAAGLGPDGTVTASAGLAMAPQDGTAPDELFQIADDRLIAAKRAGKDQARW